MTPIYNWKSGFQAKKKAQEVGEALELIRSSRGELTKSDVVESASSKSSPIHDLFEWDDQVAAHGYRLNQAGYLLRGIEVKFEETPEAPSVRAFVNFTAIDDHEYHAMETVMSNKPLRETLVAQAYEELNCWRKRYSHISELAKIFKAIDDEIK